MNRISFALILLGHSALSISAVAAPLEFQEIDELGQYLDCKTNCDYGVPSHKTGCMTHCPPFNTDWEKNGDASLDRTDYELALLEFWDKGSGTKICYDEGWVKPITACGSDTCTEDHTDEQCADLDEDGLVAWQEKAFKTSDTSSNPVCSTNAQCSFVETCVFSSAIGESRCVSRPECREKACTAYHLKLLEANNSRVIVHIYYDYSPIQARILDLRIIYNQDALNLIDSRLLPMAEQAGKGLQTSHDSTGGLRLIVFGTDSLRPIPTGPIVELVFGRTSSEPSQISFGKGDYVQKMSQAPSNEDVQEALTEDALWGSDVKVPKQTADGPRLLLYYPFDQAHDPLLYSDVKDSTELCSLWSECSGLHDEIPAEKTNKDKLLAQFEMLQRGWSKVSEPITGVRNSAAYFNGQDDHLQLPVLVENPGERSYTLETWFYAEGEISDTLPVSQILFNHQTQSEVTRYGVGLKRSSENDAVDLVWFRGDAELFDVETQPIASAVSVLDWHHLAMTVDDKDKVVKFYLDGDASPLIVSFAGETFFQCPAPEAGGSGVSFHREGDLINTKVLPETIFYASAENNLYGIARMDPNGYARQDVIRDGTFQAMDPDYSAITGKIVYISSETGNFEVWLADEDGSNARPITEGFGDTERGVFARRPKWAPDARGIVFESNVYSLEYDHNWYGRTYQLYYIAYDPVKNEVAVASPDGSGNRLSILDYNFFAQNQVLFKVYLTSDSAKHHYGVVWLAQSNRPHDLGRIAYNVAAEDYDVREVRTATIQSPEETLESVQVPVKYVGTAESNSAEMLDAYVDNGVGGTGQIELLLARAEVVYEQSSQFQVGSLEPTGDGYDVRILYSPENVDEECWDINGNGRCDPSVEDRDKRNVEEKCDVQDCYLPDTNRLYIAYPEPKVDWDFEQSTINPVLTDETGLGKVVELSQSYTSKGSFVKILIRSPFSSRPLPPGHVATLHFRLKNETEPTDIAEYQARERMEHRDLVLRKDSLQEPIEIPELREISEAKFSPDGKRVIAAGLEGTRPVLAVRDLENPNELHISKVSVTPMRVEGMDWNLAERFHPCQWVGGTRNPYSKLLKRAFRGGVDELSMYSYVREGKAILSEFERGKSWLDKAGDSAKPKKRHVSCDNDSQCPEYQLCGGDPGRGDKAGVCKERECGDQYPCPPGKGACTLLPVPSGGGGEELKWVCSVDCINDRECYEQECQNGVCRYCDTGSGGTTPGTYTCMECRPRLVEIEGLEPWMEIEGCPDRNGFTCEDGSCFSECYARANGQTRYLCDTGTEYCLDGRCVAFEWTWDDLSPSTMSGLGQMNPVVPNGFVTTAIPQFYPVKIKAYGVEDYLEPPQIIVEGKVLDDETSKLPKMVDGWFEIGVVSVYNQTESEAKQDGKEYVVFSPFPFDTVRLRLISPPLENGNRGNHGLLEGEKHFCSKWGESNQDDCIYRATGSRSQLGYPVGIPRIEARRACAKNGGTKCNYTNDDPLRPYIWGGHPAVVVLEVAVSGKPLSDLKANPVCGYAGLDDLASTRATVPGKLRDVVTMRRMVFGSLDDERSGQTSLLDTSKGPSGLQDGKAITKGSWAFLNCTLADPEDENRIAGATFTVCNSREFCGMLFSRTKSVEESGVSETAQACYYVNGRRKTPCYEWIGGGANLDFLSGERQRWQMLDFDVTRGHGH